MPASDRSSPELDLLVAAACPRVSASALDQALADQIPAVDWQRVLWLGRREGVLLHLRQALLKSGRLPNCPPEIPPQLHALAEVSHLRGLERVRELCQLGDLLAQHDVPFVVIDPPRITATEGEPEGEDGGNSFHFLVAPTDLTRATDILAAAGRATVAPDDALVRAGQRPVFLNRGIAAGPQAGRLSQNTVTRQIAGREFRLLAPAGLLLALTQPGSSSSVPSLALARTVVQLCENPTVGREAIAEAGHFDLRQELSALVAGSFQRFGLFPPPDFVSLARPATLALQPPGKSDLVPHAPFLATPTLVLERMLALAQVGASDVVYDLGCGDGRIVFKALECGAARGVGFDDDPRRIAEARATAAGRACGDRAAFVLGDFFSADLSGADIVFCYLLPGVMPPLHAKILRECRPGTRIVTHDYIFGAWPPERTEIIRVGLTRVAQIYLWRVPTRTDDA